VEIELFLKFVISFWDAFTKNITVVQEFLAKEGDKKAAEYRSKINGGNLLFRPIGLLPFIQATIDIHKRSGKTFETIFRKLNEYDYTLNSKPWRNVVWNPNEKTMIMNNSGVVKLLLLYIFGENVIKDPELLSLEEKYADRVNIKAGSAALKGIKLIK
jgi:DNA sulfur modification protein DndB